MFCDIQIDSVQLELDFQKRIHPMGLWLYLNRNFSFGLYSIGQMVTAPLVLVLASSLIGQIYAWVRIWARLELVAVKDPRTVSSGLNWSEIFRIFGPFSVRSEIFKN